MGIVYLIIFIAILVATLCAMDLDGFAIFLGIAIAIPATVMIICPHYSYDTEIIDTQTYSLIALNEIDSERFSDESTYLIYDSVNEDFIYYYKDENGVVRQGSVSADSDYVSVVRSDSTCAIDINKRDYESKVLKHLLMNSFNTEYILNIPEGSEIYHLYPEFIG